MTSKMNIENPVEVLNFLKTITEKNVEIFFQIFRIDYSRGDFLIFSVTDGFSASLGSKEDSFVDSFPEFLRGRIRFSKLVQEGTIFAVPKNEAIRVNIYNDMKGAN